MRDIFLEIFERIYFAGCNEYIEFIRIKTENK
jgi:hypothetical protein